MASNQQEPDQAAQIIIVNACQDQIDAAAFKAFIQGHCPTLKVWTEHDCLMPALDKRIETVLDNGGLVFFYLTQYFCENTLYKQFTFDLIRRYMRRGINNKFVPILTQAPNEKDSTRSYNIPFGLKSMCPLRLYRITDGARISKLVPEDMKKKKELCLGVRPYRAATEEN